MDDCQDLLPVWLRFIKGVVDSEDLPLNVSRETLQDNKIVKIMQKQVVNNCLSMLEDLASEKKDDYLKTWKSFGAVLKEGFHFAPEHRDRLAKLARFESTKADGLTSLDEYVSRMKEGQKAIYYATGASRTLLVGSPHLERLRKHDFEVLLLTDPVDPFAIAGLPKFGDFDLQSAMDEKLELDEKSEDEKKQFEDDKKRTEPLMDRFKQVLSEKVSEVRASERLHDSPVCLVVAEGGVAPHIEQMLRAQNPDMPIAKRILEVNPTHPVIERLNDGLSGDNAWVEDWMALLYDQALIAEGSPIDDPAAFSKRLSAVMARS
jgi:molecular chaperone HtpG